MKRRKRTRASDYAPLLGVTACSKHGIDGACTCRPRKRKVKAARFDEWITDCLPECIKFHGKPA